MAESSLLNVFEKLACKEEAIKGLISAASSGEKKHLIFTAAGIILCKQKLTQDQQGLSNILIAHDVIFKTNTNDILTLPELFIMVDEITAFHPINDQEFQSIITTLRK